MTAPRVSAERRAAVLAEIGALLGSALDHERALSRLVRLAVPVVVVPFESTSFRTRTSPPGRLRARRHDQEALVYEIRARHGFNPAAAQGVPAVIRTRRPALVARATEADLEAVSRNAEQLALFGQLGQKSWIIVPLVARERVLGAMTLAITESSRRYGRADLSVAMAVASQAAAVIESARLARETDEARAAAEAAIRAKDEFLSTLSHELRNPLNAVHGWASLIERGQLGEAQTRRAMQIIVRNVNAQIWLVDDLLDMSKVVSGRMRLTVQPVDLGELIADGRSRFVTRPRPSASGSNRCWRRPVFWSAATRGGSSKSSGSCWRTP
jgi:signal transduction histidine kinase